MTQGIDGPSTVQEGTTSFEVEVSNGADTLYVTVDAPQTNATVSVGEDGKATITVPAGTKGGAVITVSDGRNPPSFLFVEVVSTS